MKMVKSLILGSAAGLLAMGGAQAADLPVKAKAVEYVRICSLYGAGFYYIPGTDTCIKIGGYAQISLGLNTDSIYDAPRSGAAGAFNRYSNYYTARSRNGLDIDTRTATEYGVVRTYANMVFTWTDSVYTGNPASPGSTVYGALGGGGVAGLTAAATTGLPGSGQVGPASAPGNANSGSVAAGQLGVYYAFIQFAGFTMGKAVSQFSAPWTNYPGNLFDGLPGGGGTVTGVNQFTYTAQFGNGVQLALSAQDQVVYTTTAIGNLSAGLTAANLAAGTLGASDIGGTRAPDLIAHLRVDQAWGLFQASFAAHLNHAGYYAGGLLAGQEPNGHPDDKWGWAASLALSIKNIPTGPGDTINIQGVYTNGASRYNFQDLMATNYVMFGGTGVPGAYQSIGIGAVTDSLFINGGQQQLTTTYGFRGAYTHNWDAYWNTAIYGAWAAVRHNDTAKALICTGPAGVTGLQLALSTGLAGCNPDFNYSAVGIITRWTPVRNLTFSVDTTYTMLDQKYGAGSTFVLAAPALAIAKPAAVYEIKDQAAVSMLLRAQRNF